MEATGKISDELEAKTVTGNARFQLAWAIVEELSQKQLDESMRQASTKSRLEQTGPDCSTKFLLQNTRTAIYIIERKLQSMVDDSMKGAYDMEAVLKPEASADSSVPRLPLREISVAQSTGWSAWSVAAKGKRFLLQSASAWHDEGAEVA